MQTALNNPNMIQLGRYSLPIALLADVLSFCQFNQEYLNFIIVAKTIYQVFNTSLKKTLLDSSFDSDDEDGDNNFFLKKYIEIYPDIGPIYYGDIPEGSYRRVLFSAAKRNDEAMLNIAFEDSRIKEMKPTYKINFCEFSGFVNYSDEMTDDESYAGITLLGVAAEANSFKAIDSILRHGGAGEDANSMQCWGYQVLSVAAWNSAVESVDVLVKHKANVNAVSMKDYSWQSWAAACMGVTALHATFLGPLSRQDYSEETKRKCYEIVKILVANGADVNKCSGPCKLYNEVSYNCGPQAEGNGNRFTDITALHLATLCRNKDAVQHLLACGALQRRICKEGKLNFNLTLPPKEKSVVTGGIGQASDRGGGDEDDDEGVDDVGGDGWCYEANEKEDEWSLDDYYDEDIDYEEEIYDIANNKRSIQDVDIPSEVSEYYASCHKPTTENSLQSLNREGSNGDNSMDVDDDNNADADQSENPNEWLEILPWRVNGRAYNRKYSTEQIRPIKLQIVELTDRMKNEVKNKLIEKKTLQTTASTTTTTTTIIDDDNHLSGEDDVDESNIDDYVKSKVRSDKSFVDMVTGLFTEYFDKLDIEIEREKVKNNLEANPLDIVYDFSVDCDRFYGFPCRRGFFPVTLALSAAAASRKSNEKENAEAYESIAEILLNSENKGLILPLPRNGTTLRNFEDDDVGHVETVGEFINRYGGNVDGKSEDEGLLGDDMSVNNDDIIEEDDQYDQEENTNEALKAMCLALTTPTPSSCAEVLGAFCERLVNQFKMEVISEDDHDENGSESIPPAVVHAIARMMSLLVIRFHKSFVTAGGSNNSEVTKRQKLSDDERFQYALGGVFEEGSALSNHIRSNVSGVLSSLENDLFIDPSDIIHVLENVSNMCNIAVDELALAAGDDINYKNVVISSSHIYSSILLQVLTLDFLYETNDNVQLLYTGCSALNGKLPEDMFSESTKKPYANFLWMYVATLSEHNEYMQAYFPSIVVSHNENQLKDGLDIDVLTKCCNVDSNDIWSIAKSLRSEDREFKTYVKNLLLDESTDYASSNFQVIEDQIASLTELNMNDVLTDEEASTIVLNLIAVIQTIDDDCDEDDEGESKESLVLLRMVENLNWPLSEVAQDRVEEMSSSFGGPKLVTDFRSLRLLGDGYVYLGQYDKAIASYEQAVQLAESHVTYAAGDQSGHEKKIPKSSFSFYSPMSSSTIKEEEEKCQLLSAYASAKMAHFGLAEAYAAIGNVERSLNAFEKTLEM